MQATSKRIKNNSMAEKAFDEMLKKFKTINFESKNVFQIVLKIKRELYDYLFESYEMKMSETSMIKNPFRDSLVIEEQLYFGKCKIIIYISYDINKIMDLFTIELTDILNDDESGPCITRAKIYDREGVV